MVRKILIAVAALLIVFSTYLIWQYRQIKPALDVLSESLNAVAGIFDKPIVTEEYFSPDSTLKIGLYQVMKLDSGNIHLSQFEISMIDTSLEYPLTGNIITESEIKPIIKWVSNDSVLFVFDSTFSEITNFPNEINAVKLHYKY